MSREIENMRLNVIEYQDISINYLSMGGSIKLYHNLRCDYIFEI